MRPYTVIPIGYTYRADNYCLHCVLVQLNESTDVVGYGEFAATLHRVAKTRGINHYDETSYDSGDFPKVLFADMVTEDDYCGGCERKL